MDLNIFDFSLPERYIGQKPKNKRSDSKLLIISRKTHELTDDKFINIDRYIGENDLVIINDTKVIPARIFGTRKSTKGKVEILIERLLFKNKFICQLQSTRKLKKGDIIIVGNEVELQIGNNNGILCEINILNHTTTYLINKYGETPLPPYITRKPDYRDKNYYQTIFASKDGSVAAPTAALHFDNSVVKKLKTKGVRFACITLHIGMGTFSTIKTKDINKHRMHSELYSVPQSTVDLIKKCKDKNGKIISIGTTVARALESFYSERNVPDKFYETDIFIKPGYKFKIIDHLVTNFHLPQSSLLIMVAAFYDTKKILDVYKHAIKNDYKFFSYGDSTLIL
tara:strand:+ start:223 stop:1242 length:1020 start_codon:yes stop_codon:yes gene_type:complete